MITLKEMIIEVLKKSDDPITVKDLTDKLVLEFNEKLEDKKTQFNGDEKKAKQQIYREIHRITLSDDSTFFRDKSVKPLKVGLVEEDEYIEEELENEDFESDEGIVYILATNTFTKDAKEIVKIGKTTQKIEDRIKNLYKTNTVYKYTILKLYTTNSYEKLESGMQKLLNRYRLNASREFFTIDCLEFADEIYEIFKRVEGN